MRCIAAIVVVVIKSLQREAAMRGNRIPTISASNFIIRSVNTGSFIFTNPRAKSISLDGANDARLKHSFGQTFAALRSNPPFDSVNR